jgi:Tfp pilus assembly protein PilO
MKRALEFKSRLRRLGWWWRQHQGGLGLAALALFLVAVALAQLVRPAIEQARVVALSDSSQSEQAASRQSLARLAASQRDPREDWLNALPEDRDLSDTVSRLLALLHESSLTADTADYVAEPQEPGLLRLRVSVPLNGSYGQARKLLAAILEGLPNAALDGLELEHQQDNRQSLSGQMRLSLFFRRSAR